MKKFLLSLLTIALAYASQAQTKTDNLDIVFIGNSITYGATLASPGTEAPPVRVKEILSEKIANEVSITNCGHSGSTTLNWLPGTSFMNEALNAAKNLQQDGGNLFFSLMLGTNDSAEQGPTGSPVSPANYKANVITIINKLLSEYPDARIILNYPMWYSPNTHNGATYLQAGLDRLNSYHPMLNEIISEMQANGKQVFAGSTAVYGYFQNVTSLFTAEGGYDGTFYLHPNKEGAIKLAEFWAGSILEHAQDITTTDTSAVRLKQLIASAQQKTQSVYARTSGLISSISQITTNASGNDNPNIPNNLANLIDGNRNTIYQTWPNYPATGYAYLQFDLSATPVSSVYIDMAPWPSADGVPDMPKKVKFSLSADGGATWDKEIDYTVNLKPGFGLSDTYHTPLIDFGGTYNTVRMTMIEHQADRVATHPKLFGMSIFQMYALRNDAPYYDTDVRSAGEALEAATIEAQAHFDQGDFSDSVFTALQTVIATFDTAKNAYEEQRHAEEKNYTRGDKLITKASQFSTNCPPLSDFSLANLIDGNDRNIYHSWSGATRTERCWIQVDLDHPVEKFYMNYIPHKYRSWGLVEQDNPSKITVLVSKDNTNWTQALVLDESMGMPTKIDQNYDSPLLSLGSEYQHIRFRIDNTLGNRADGGSVIVTIAEMQLYEAKKLEPAVFTLEGTTLKATGNINADTLTQAIADNPTALSIDLTEADLSSNVTAKTVTSAMTGNQLVFVPSSYTWIGKNVVKGTKAITLALTDGYDFCPAIEFTASKVSYTREIKDTNWSTLCLPFSYTVPEGIIFAHNPTIEDATLYLEQYEPGTTVPACQPVMIKANEPMTLTLDGKSTTYKPEYTTEELTENNLLVGTFQTLPVSDTQNPLDPASSSISAFYAYLTTTAEGLTISDDLTAILNTPTDPSDLLTPFDLSGQKLPHPSKGQIYILNGKKIKK